MISVKDGEEAIAELEKGHPELAIIGTNTTKVPASEIVNYARKVMKSDLPIIVVADLDEEDAVLELIKAGANDFTLRPFKPKELVMRIKKLLRQVEAS